MQQQRLRAIIRALVNGFEATRYLISWAVLAIVAIYCLLNLLNYVPAYPLLADSTGIGSRWLLGLLYALVAAVVLVVNWLLVLRPQAPPPAMLSLRALYQQTDPTGVRLVNLLVLAAAVGGPLVAIRLFKNEFIVDGIVFIAIVLALPVAMDFLPFLRPRRVCVPRDGRTIHEIAERLSTDPLDPFAANDLAYALLEYNRDDLPQPICFGGDGADLPDDPNVAPELRPLKHGIVLDIPPRS